MTVFDFIILNRDTFSGVHISVIFSLFNNHYIMLSNVIKLRFLSGKFVSGPTVLTLKTDFSSINNSNLTTISRSLSLLIEFGNDFGTSSVSNSVDVTKGFLVVIVRNTDIQSFVQNIVFFTFLTLSSTTIPFHLVRLATS